MPDLPGTSSCRALIELRRVETKLATQLLHVLVGVRRRFPFTGPASDTGSRGNQNHPVRRRTPGDACHVFLGPTAEIDERSVGPAPNFLRTSSVSRKAPAAPDIRSR
jgi:hypothetical protein